jgi:hypothetical protein
MRAGVAAAPTQPSSLGEAFDDAGGSVSSGRGRKLCDTASYGARHRAQMIGRGRSSRMRVFA